MAAQQKITCVCCTIACVALFAPARSLSSDCIGAEQLRKEAAGIIQTAPATAEQELRKALAMCGESNSIRFSLASALHRGGKHSVARAVLEEILERTPEYPPALNGLAILLLAEGGDGAVQALALAKRAVSLVPGNDDYSATLTKVEMALRKAAHANINLAVPPQGATKRQHGVAVIIGNRNYRHPGVPGVEYANNDASLMKSYLATTLGYSPRDIIFVQDALLSDFNRIFGTANSLGQIHNWTKPGKSDVFVYYVGHGAPDLKSEGAYFVPVDADPDYIVAGGYSLDLFWENMGKLNALSLTVVLDTCFSGDTERESIVDGMSPVMLKVDAELRGPAGSVVMTSGTGNQVSSWYPEMEHSLFTYYWLKGIAGAADKDANNAITVKEMREYLCDEVSYTARRERNREQTPVVTGDDDHVLVNLK